MTVAADAYAHGPTMPDALSNMTKIYCAPGGDDTTGDGSIGNPYRTPKRAFQDGVLAGTQRTVIFLAAGTYDTGSDGMVMPHVLGDGNMTFADHAIVGYAMYGDLTIEGELVVDESLTYANVTQTQPGAMSGLFDVRDSGKSWTLNEWKGYFLVDETGYSAEIRGNETNGTLHTCSAFAFPGTNLRIVHPGAILEVSDAASWAQGISFPSAGCSVVIRGCRLASTTAGQNSGILDVGGATVQMEMCELSDVLGSTRMGSLWLRSCYVHKEPGAAYAPVSFFTNINLRVENTHFADQHHFLGNSMPTAPVFTACYFEDFIQGIGYGGNQSVAGAAPFGLFNCEIKDANVVCRGPGLFVVSNVTINGAGSADANASGLTLREGATCNIAYVDGTAGGLYGVSLHDQSQLYYNHPAPCTITGSLGALKVGLLKVRPWYALGKTTHFKIVDPTTQCVAGAPDGILPKDYNPAARTNAKCWLRSDKGLEFYQNTLQVGKWKNQVAGISGDASQNVAAGKCPLLGLFDGLNGRPRLTFDGTDDYFDWALSLDGAKTIIFVLKSASNPASSTYRVIAEIYKSGSGKVSSWWQTGNSPIKQNWGDDHTSSQAGIAVDAHLGTDGVVLIHSWDGVSVTSTSSYASSINGSAQSLSAGGSIDPTSETGGAIGCWHRDGMYFFAGDMYEIYVESGVMSADDQSDHRVYLNDLYNLWP